MKETFKRLWPRYNHALLLIYFLILWLLGSKELKQILAKTKKNN